MVSVAILTILQWQLVYATAIIVIEIVTNMVAGAEAVIVVSAVVVVVVVLVIAMSNIDSDMSTGKNSVMNSSGRIYTLVILRVTSFQSLLV